MNKKPKAAPDDDFSVITASRRESLARVDQPVVLISQLPRSGGTLLLRLFDGHPQCHTFPHEFGREFGLKIDPKWSPDEAWAKLHDRKLASWFKGGFGVAQRKATNASMVRFPLLISPSFQQSLFHELYPSKENFSPREVFNAYLTSYFNAWIDNQNLVSTPKGWIVAFEAAGILSGKFRKQFNENYPDGRFISIVREPQSWFASAQGWSFRWAAVTPGMEVWRNGVETLLEVKRENPERMTILLFHDLVQRTDDMMATLGKLLHIRNARECAAPTFNGRPVVPNTSFRLQTTEVSTDPLKRAKSLSEAERRQVDQLAGDLMDRVIEVATRPLEKSERVKASKGAKKKLGKGMKAKAPKDSKVKKAEREKSKA